MVIEACERFEHGTADDEGCAGHGRDLFDSSKPARGLAVTATDGDAGVVRCVPAGVDGLRILLEQDHRGRHGGARVGVQRRG